jgi:membrane-bound lytic murein transglycosylase F
LTQIRLILLTVFFLLTGCSDGVIVPLHRAHELVVLTREGPTTYAANASLGEVGFEHDLAVLFGEEIGLPVRFIVAGDESDLRRRLQRGEGQLAAAWLSSEDDKLPSSRPYAESSSILVTHEASLPITRIERANGKTVSVVAGSREASVLRKLHAKAPNMRIDEVAAASALDLLEGVARRRYGAVVVDHTVFDIGSNFYPELIGSIELGQRLPIAWQFPPAADTKLIEEANAFFARIENDGTLARLKERYFGHIDHLAQIDLTRFIERTRTVLPQYRALFQEAQARAGIDWRTLAALAYQESQWDPVATSATGVRGMMMLTTETADRLRVGNRLDARQSVLAGARYLADLRDALPPGVREPDRLWLAIAAYNLGLGHLNGGRSIATSMKADPDSWYEMKKVLPQLSRPEIYRRLKSGKARGGEAVIMVENVRIYADILARHEIAWRPLEHLVEAEAGVGAPTLKAPPAAP